MYVYRQSSIAHFISLMSPTGVEPKIYYILGENANHCMIEVMQIIYLLYRSLQQDAIQFENLFKD